MPNVEQVQTSSSIVESLQTDELLLRLFDRHFNDEAMALLRLRERLHTITLPFDLFAWLEVPSEIRDHP